MAKSILLPPLLPTAPISKTIPTSSAPPGTTSSLSLDDNQKRWLIVGICLNKILLPTLRQFLQPELAKHYIDLITKHNIDKQTYHKHLQKDGTVKLNYESINSNERTHRKNVRAYDFCVKSEVDLAKLYLRPYMATFTAIDNTCDLSAVLGVLGSASVFSSTLHKFANDIRQEVRNEWGHCNFANWDEIKFGRCFQLMDSVIRKLSLIPSEEKKLSDELGDWELKGMTLCLVHIVDADLVRLIEQEVSHLAIQVELLDKNQQEEAQKIKDALQLVVASIDDFKANVSKSIESLESSSATLHSQVTELSEDVENLQKDQQLLRDDTNERFEALERAIENNGLAPTNNTFQAPNQIPYFCGRSVELEHLNFQVKSDEDSCVMSAICGLGGIGKTSLAIEHIWKSKDIYKGGVFWLSGESDSLFKNTLSEMARQVGTFHEEFPRMLSKTLHWLEVQKDVWCIVVDNLDKMDLKDSTDMMKLLYGHWKRNTSGHIILTTRREVKQIQEDIPELTSDNCILLNSLSEQESVQFLKQRTGRLAESHSDEKILQDIATELGYLPLALDQAAAYIKCTEIKLPQYLEQYRKLRLKTLDRFKAHIPVQDTSKERIAVRTTWQLNFDYVRSLSEEYGIGQAASLVMEVSAFLYPDDIPLEIINEGLPQVEHEDLRSCLTSSFGVTDIISILTKFSLFQKYTEKSVSVHRLVQEVIRSNITKDGDRTISVLQSACRMLRHAFLGTNSPKTICESFVGETVFNVEKPPSLFLWGKLGAHAEVLQKHLIEMCTTNTSLCPQLLYTEEMAFLLNEASLYLSVCRQKAEAQDLQNAKLEIMTRLDLTKETLASLKYFKIPLKSNHFKLLSHCMSNQEQGTVADSNSEEMKDLEQRADEWRGKGNASFSSEQYQQAIDNYSVALKWFSNDCRSLCNRALCYLKLSQPEKALEDCERCLKIEKHNAKALRRKAWALHDISNGKPYLLERAKATAALAAFVDPTALEKSEFRCRFSNPRYIEIFNSAQLIAHLLYHDQDTTFLLHKGHYDLKRAFLDSKNIHFVSIDGHVTLKFGAPVVVYKHLYAEGISFSKGCESIMACFQGSSITMINCQITGGGTSCQDFPDCNGGDGCVASLCPGRKPCDRTGKFGGCVPSGVPGFPAIKIVGGGSGYFEHCDIAECGGGGLLSHGPNSYLFVKSCKAHHNHQAALEAREGGQLIAVENDIYSNGCHGVLIGPQAGVCLIDQNSIYENNREGIMVCVSLNSEVTISRNRIHHNQQFGISLDRCVVQIKHNEIFDNGFYGIHAKNITTATIKNNDIYSNKCGGIHKGINFSGRINILSNTIRDHIGKWLITPTISEALFKTFLPSNITAEELRKLNLFLPEGEDHCYSNPPIEKDNVIKERDSRCFHPVEKMKLVPNECAFCHRTSNLKKCSRCNIASYCSTQCQENHWQKHQPLCSTISEDYFVIVDLKPYSDPESLLVSFRFCGPHLKGIRQGPKPNPKSDRKFVVKIQTQHMNYHPLQELTLYDQSTSIDGSIQSPEIFHIIMECGVLGTLEEFTSKKAFFHANFVDQNPKKLRISLARLADYAEW